MPLGACVANEQLAEVKSIIHVALDSFHGQGAGFPDPALLANADEFIGTELDGKFLYRWASPANDSGKDIAS